MFFLFSIISPFTGFELFFSNTHSEFSVHDLNGRNFNKIDGSGSVSKFDIKGTFGISINFLENDVFVIFISFIDVSSLGVVV